LADPLSLADVRHPADTRRPSNARNLSDTLTDMLNPANAQNLVVDVPGPGSSLPLPSDWALAIALQLGLDFPGYQTEDQTDVLGRRNHSVPLAIAFVSGHSQGGAGLQALLQDLETNWRLKIRTAVVLGGVRGSQDLNILAIEDAPLWLVKGLSDLATRKGLSPRVLKNHRFTEIPILHENGIPSVGLGMPESFPASTEKIHLFAQVYPDQEIEADKIFSLLRAAVSEPASLSPETATLFQPLRHFLVVRAIGKVFFVPRKALATSFFVLGLVFFGLAARSGGFPVGSKTLPANRKKVAPPH